MKIHRLFTLGILGAVLLAGTAFAQNINTDTTSTTVGSTQFGVVLNELDLQTIMQSSVALTCAGPVDARTCTPAGNGTSTAFVRVDALPGSFTDSPTGAVSSLPNFACGPTASSLNCALNLSVVGAPPGDQAQTAPNFTGRQLVGNIDTSITVGDGGTTVGMPDGFLNFTLNPATGEATIDQFIDHSIDLGGGSMMVFQQRDATTGGAPIGTIDDPALTLVAFTALDIPSLGLTTPIPATGMVSRTILNQGNADGFGGLNLDVSVNFPGQGAGADFPLQGTFVTPGLNTGINPAAGSGFGPEFNGFAFP